MAASRLDNTPPRDAWQITFTLNFYKLNIWLPYVPVIFDEPIKEVLYFFQKSQGSQIIIYSTYFQEVIFPCTLSSQSNLS